MTSLVQSIDKAALPAAAKAALRNRLAALQKRVLEDQKAAAAANKAQATATAVKAADSSAAAGRKHVVLRLEVRALIWVCLQFASTTGCMETPRCWMAKVAKIWASGVQVGLDTKALLEAWTAIQKKHPELPVFIVTSDTGTLVSVCHVDCSHIRLLSDPASI